MASRSITPRPLRTSNPSRRSILKKTGTVISGTALAAIAARAHAAEDNTIRFALIGCGGRGTGAAANALSTQGPTKLVAMADLFADRLDFSLQYLTEQFGKQIDVPPERRFLGFDSYRKAMDVLKSGDVVLLTTPPVFRPLHFEYAVGRGLNVFMEKSFAVDAPGIRRVLAEAEISKQKNLNVVGGLIWHHDKPRQAFVAKMRENAIGQLIFMRSYWLIPSLGLSARRPDEGELAHQIRNFGNFLWTGGGAYSERVIQNVDFCCWVKDALPIAAIGMGGRAARRVPDQVFDHYGIEYILADGSRYFVQARNMDGCYATFGDYFHGTSGSAGFLANAGARPRIYRSQIQTKENEIWRYAGDAPDPYHLEMDVLFDAIRNNRPVNEAERCANSGMVCIMGRMAVHGGQLVTWDAAMKSDLALAPDVDHMTWQTRPPVQPDETGHYPIPVPGKTKAM